MKSKISKIMGIGLTFVLLVSMMVFALPVSADPYPPLAPALPNTWDDFVPTPGAPGGWFNDPTITKVGPIAQSPVDDDLYASVNFGPPLGGTLGTSGGTSTATWAFNTYVSPDYSAALNFVDAHVYVDITPAAGYTGLDFSTAAATDFGFWYYQTAEAGFGPQLELKFDDPGSPAYMDITFMLQANTTLNQWTWVNLGSPFGAIGTWDGTTFTPCADLTAAKTAIGALPTYELTKVRVELYDDPAPARICYIDNVCVAGSCSTFDPAMTFFKSTDGGRTWAESLSLAKYAGGPVVDMVCSDLFEDVIYVTDGTYVYRSVDGGTSFAPVAAESLEKAIEADCGDPILCKPITCLDMGYDASDNPFVFIGVKHTNVNGPPSVLYISEAGYPSEWTDLQLNCYGGGGYVPYSVGVAPDFATSKKIYVVVSNGTDTHVVSTIGTPCGWTGVSELLYNCATSFDISRASRFAFSTTYDTNSTMFVGVVGETVGGDVYRVVDGPPTATIDLNVRGFTTGCLGLFDANICSLDIKAGDALIAGAFDGTDVYYSNDGGWTWAGSLKNPTGEGLTYVLWVGDSALAATLGCDCAVSMSCGETVGQFFNQISLISMEIDKVLDLSHAPGYLDGSSTMYVLTNDAGACITDNTSLLRWDGTYWERVFSTFTYDAEMDWVEVSPDFNDTSCVYLANAGFDMFRSLDAGCSWTALVYPCEPKPEISAWIVVDEETVLAAGTDPDDGNIYRTTYHGTQPWDAFPVAGAGNGVDFDLSPNIANDSSVLFGDSTGHVFLSRDLGATWTTWVGAPLAVANTYVVFDPGYGTAGDPGEYIIYAAKGAFITRCDLSAVEAGMGTIEFVQIGAVGEASGIAAAGDTALYVADAVAVDTNFTTGGVLRSLNPMAPAVPTNFVVFEQLNLGLAANISALEHPSFSDDLWLTAGSNMLWALDSGNIDTIWMWDDVLATPVIQVAPTDGTALVTPTTATLTWEALDAATLYEISLYRYCPQCPDEMLPVYVSGTDNYTSADTCLIVTGLDSGTKYYWMVRVAKGHPYLSKWSDLRTFDTALGSVTVLCSPICGASDIILTTNFSWDAVPGAAAYELQVVAASADGTADFTGAATYTSDVNALASIPGLEYSTVYYWQVRAIKDGVAGAWAVCLFTTEAVPEEPVAVEPITPVDVIIEEITPLWIWVIIGIGAVLVIAVIILIVTTRRVP